MRKLVTWVATMVLLGLSSRSSVAETPAPGGLSHGNQGFVLTPTRIVFEGRQRAATLTVANTGSSKAEYRVTLVRMRMSRTGEISMVDAPLAGEAFADTLVRYSPRQFEVAPRASQVVRIQLRKPADLPDGEYRSHLLIQEVPPPGAATEEVAGSGVLVRLLPVFGTAIPLIVRHGAPAAAVSFEGFFYRAAADRPSVSFLAVRNGTRSVYGDFECLIEEEGRKPRLVGRLRGVAVYAPNPDRWIEIPLDTPLPPAAGGRLRVRFAETAAPAAAMAESTFAVR